jgi:hypothetical protein
MQVRPDQFTQKPTIDGTEWLYTQNGGISEKFSVDQIVAQYQSIAPLQPSIPYRLFPDETMLNRQYQGKPVYETLIFLQTQNTTQAQLLALSYNLGAETILESNFYFFDSSNKTYISILNFRDDDLFSDQIYLEFELDGGILNVVSAPINGIEDPITYMLIKYTKI